MNVYGISSVNIDYSSRALCEAEGKRVIGELRDTKYFCIERK